jgi:hypothetical protein
VRPNTASHANSGHRCFGASGRRESLAISDTEPNTRYRRDRCGGRPGHGRGVLQSCEVPYAHCYANTNRKRYLHSFSDSYPGLHTDADCKSHTNSHTIGEPHTVTNGYADSD